MGTLFFSRISPDGQETRGPKTQSSTSVEVSLYGGATLPPRFSAGGYIEGSSSCSSITRNRTAAAVVKNDHDQETCSCILNNHHL